MIGRSRALNEAHEVGRADHVEIDVEHDVTTVIFGQTVDMLTRAHETLLLCSPEGETHATACSGRLPHQSQRRFEHRGRAATIIVDARSLQHAVEMRTNDNQGTIATGGGAGPYAFAPQLFCPRGR